MLKIACMTILTSQQTKSRDNKHLMLLLETKDLIVQYITLVPRVYDVSYSGINAYSDVGTNTQQNMTSLLFFNRQAANNGP
jgi:hypothetical protein